MQLYAYDHCPFCVKARMIFGFTQQPLTLTVLANDDEKTPTDLVGKKMLPILIKQDGQAMGESMDIVHYVDQLNATSCFVAEQNPAIERWLKEVNSYLNQLLMPVIAATDFEEFKQPSGRDYFINKKQASYGDFAELSRQRAQWVERINQDLTQLSSLIKGEDAVNGQRSLDDIHLFPILRSLTLIKEIHWPTNVATLRDNLSQQSNVPLLFNLAK